MITAIVNKIIDYSFVDGPGNRTVIFLQGCNFNCSYCHNPETINVCSKCGYCIKSCNYNALKKINEVVFWDDELCQGCDACIKNCPNNSSPKTKIMSTNEVFEIILKNASFISGITISGGECTLHRDFILEIARKVKSLNLNVLLDTNGSFDFANDNELTSIIDGIMLDIKCFDTHNHKIITSKPNDIVLKNAVYMAKLNKLVEIRTVVIPDILPNGDTINNITTLLSSYNLNNMTYKLIKYRPLGVREEFLNYKTPSDSLMNILRNIAVNNGFNNVQII